MTIKELFELYPRKSTETVIGYTRRIASKCEFTQESIRKTYYNATKRAAVVTSTNYDAKGNVKSYTEKMQQSEPVHFDMPVKRVSTNITTGQQWIIQENKDNEPIDIESIVTNAVKFCDRTPILFKRSKNFENKIVNNIITDVHAGMSVDGGFLNYEWNSKKLYECFEQNLNDLISLVNQTGGRVKELYLYDLGDDLDGFEGRTTRGGHELAQNMTTEQQFATVLDVHLSFIEEILKLDLCDSIILHRCENNNHGGSFSKVLGHTMETIIKKLYPEANITFNRQSDFISYNLYGENAIVTTHGKDMTYMKAPMPYILTGNWETYLTSIFKKWGILDKKIRLYKGDQHRLGFTSHTMLEYYNFMAFSPPSGWVQTNFGATEDVGYSIHVMGEKRDDYTIFNRRFKI